MNVSRSYCAVLMVMLLMQYGSGTGIISKSVCLGDTVQLFKDSRNLDLYLFINGVNHTLIGMWTVKTSILLEYRERLFRDENGAVWLRDVDLSDEAKYVIQYEIDSASNRSEVRLDVMVAPKKNCKPKIVRIDNFLNASLEAKDCGRPLAAVYWKDINDNVYRSNTEIKLLSENKDVTYIACIDGPALQCEKTLKRSDYCSTINIQGNNSPTVTSEVSDMIRSIFWTGIIILVIVVTVAISVLIYWGKRTHEKRKTPREPEEDMALLDDIHTQNPGRVSMHQSDDDVAMPIRRNPWGQSFDEVL